MQVCACFLVFGIFANRQSFAYKPEINPKALNLAFETVLEFPHETKQSDIRLLDNIQNVITEMRTIIDKSSNKKNFRRNSKDETLTGFIQDAINIINTYKDTTFDDFVQILDDEIKQYDYRGCKFYELMENHETEEFITTKLDWIKSGTTNFKKKKINALSAVLKYESYDRNVKNIVDYINSLYTEAGDKFRRFLSNLKSYGQSKSSRSNIDLVKIIKNGLRSIIFDHYTNLSIHTRRHLRHQIEFFWRRYKNNDPSKGDNVAKVTPYNTKNFKNIIKEAKTLEPDSRKYQKNTNNKINQNWFETKLSHHKNKIKKKYDLTNDKKRQKNIRKETIDSSDSTIEIQEKETGQSSQDSDLVVKQGAEIKLQGQTEDEDSLSASINFIDLHKDQQDNTQQYKALVPDKNTQKPEIIDTLDVTTKTSTNNTTRKNVLWIEQSTGRLPKAVLDILANKTSRSNPNLNKYGPKHKKNRDLKTWMGNKPYKIRRIGYEPENAKTHAKMYDPQNDKTFRFKTHGRTTRDKTIEKIDQQENDKTYGKIYKQAGDKTRANIIEAENNKIPRSVYNSENDKTHAKNYDPQNDKTLRYSELIRDKTIEKIDQQENDKTYGKIYEQARDITRANMIEAENNKIPRSVYESENDKTHEKNYDPQNDKTLRYSELIRDKTIEKIDQQENDKTYGKIYEQAGDKTRANINEPEHNKTPRSVYESENDKTHKKNYDQQNDKTLRYSELIRDKTIEKIDQQENDKTYGKIYEQARDITRANMIEAENNKISRSVYGSENDKTHEKNYDPQNDKTLRYSELIRDKTIEKIDQQENDKTYGKIYEQAGDKTRTNIIEAENNKIPRSVYESENDKMHEKIYELENNRAEGKINDRSHESEGPTMRFEFKYNYKLKEDQRHKYKNLNPNEPTNIKRYETDHEKIQGNVFKPEYDKTHGVIYEADHDKMRRNILYDKHEITSAIKNQFMYESKEDNHKPYNTSKPGKPSIIKPNFRNLFSYHGVRTNFAQNKDEDVQQYKNTKGILRVELKHDNQRIRSTTKRIQQVLDVQMLTDPGQTIKHLARRIATTRKAPAFSRLPRLQLDDLARMKPTHQTSPQSNSSLVWLHVDLPLKAYTKSNNKWFRKYDIYSRKSTKYSTSFKEGITTGNIKIIDDNRQKAQTTSLSYLKDSSERKLNRGQNAKTTSLSYLKDLSERQLNRSQNTKTTPFSYLKDSSERQSNRGQNAKTTFLSYLKDLSERQSNRGQNAKTTSLSYLKDLSERHSNQGENAKTASLSYLKDSFERQSNRGQNAKTTSFNHLKDSSRRQVNRGLNAKTTSFNYLKDSSERQSNQGENAKTTYFNHLKDSSRRQVNRGQNAKTTSLSYLKDSSERQSNRSQNAKTTSFSYLKDSSERQSNRGQNAKTTYFNHLKDASIRQVNRGLNAKTTSFNYLKDSSERQSNQGENAKTTSLSYLKDSFERQSNRGQNAKTTSLSYLKDLSERQSNQGENAKTTPFSYLKDSFERQSNRGQNAKTTSLSYLKDLSERQSNQGENAKTTPFSYLKDSFERQSNRGQNAKTTFLSYLKDSSERQLNRSQNAKTTSFSYLNELNRGINRANDITEEGSKVKHRFEVKSYFVKRKQIEAKSTSDDTFRQDTSKMAETADHETDLTNYVTDKDSKIKDYDVGRGITLETMFRSGVIIPDFKVNDKLKTVKTAVNNTGYFNEDHKYAENNIENYEKSEAGFKSGFKITINDMVRLNVTGAVQNKTDFTIEHVVDEDSKNNEDRIEKTGNFNTMSKSNANDVSKVTQNKLKIAGTAINKIEHIMENNYFKDKDSTNNEMSKIRFRADSNTIHKDFKDMTDNTEVTETVDNITEFKNSIINKENGKKSETSFTSNINMMPNNFNNKTDQTNTRIADIKTDFIRKDNNFKSKEGIIDKDHQTYQVDDQTSIVQEAPNRIVQIEKDTKQQHFDDITFKAKYIEALTKDSEVKVNMKDQKNPDFLNNDYNASKGTQTPTSNIASTSSSIKGTESSRKASATTVVQTAPTTPKLLTFITFFKAPDIWNKAEFNAIHTK